jgi:carbon-monoxide dehydrogenase catalytic subunit
MSEKAVAIGHYFVASGIDVILGHPFRVSGSQAVTKLLTEEANDLFGAAFHVCPDPQQAVEKIMELLTRDRERLGINRKAERKMMSMKDRRALTPGT